MIKLLHDDPFFRVELNESDAILRAARTARAFNNVAEAERAYRDVERALTALPRGGRLLLDLREAPALEDPAFESILGPILAALFKSFSRVAVVVRTNQTPPTKTGPAVAVFHDEDAAFDHLLA